MKKTRLLITIASLFTITLSSCGTSNYEKISLSTISRDFITNSEMLDDYYIPIDYQGIINLLESKEQFAVYYSSPTCYNCTIAKPHMIEFIKQTKLQIYYFEVHKDDHLDLLNEQYPDIFDRMYTPTLHFYKNGTRLHRYEGSNKLDSVSKIKALFRGLTTINPLNYIYTYSHYQTLLAEGEPILLIDKSKSDQANDFTSIYYDSLEARDKTTYIYDISYTGLVEKQTIMDNLNYDGNAIAAVNKEKGLTYASKTNSILDYFN